MTHPLLSGLASAQGLLATDRAAGRQALTELWDGLDPRDAAARCYRRLGRFEVDHLNPSLATRYPQLFSTPIESLVDFDNRFDYGMSVIVAGLKSVAADGSR